MASGKQRSAQNRAPDPDVKFCQMLWDYIQSIHQDKQDSNEIANKYQTKHAKSKANKGHYTENIGKAVCISNFLLKDYCNNYFKRVDRDNLKTTIEAVCSAWLKTRKNIFVKVLDALAIFYDVFLHCTFSKDPKEEATQLFLEFFKEELFSEFTARGGWKKLDQTAKYYTDLFAKVYKLTAFSGSIREHCDIDKKTCCELINCLMDSAVPFPVVLNIYCTECKKNLIKLDQYKEIVFLETREIVLKWDALSYYFISMSIKDIANFVINSYDLLQNPTLSNLFTSNQMLLHGDSIPDDFDKHNSQKASIESKTLSSIECQNQQSIEALPHSSLQKTNALVQDNIIPSLQKIHVDEASQVSIKPAHSNLREQGARVKTESKPKAKIAPALNKKKSVASVKEKKLSVYNSSRKYNCTVNCDLLKRIINKSLKEKENTSDAYEEKLHSRSLKFEIHFKNNCLSIGDNITKSSCEHSPKTLPGNVFKLKSECMLFLDNFLEHFINILLKFCYDDIFELSDVTDKIIYHLLSDGLDTYLINCLSKSISKLLNERRSLTDVKANPEILNMDPSNSVTKADGYKICKNNDVDSIDKSEEHCINLAFLRFKFHLCSNPLKEWELKRNVEF